MGHQLIGIHLVSLSWAVYGEHEIRRPETNDVNGLISENDVDKLGAFFAPR